MRCSEIIERLENLSPLSFAEDWDNIGLLAGRRDKEVKSIYIALDATDEVIEDAIRQEADMLLTHHPLIFTKLNRIDTDHFIGRRLFKLIQNDISYYAMHTNFDVMGMADAAADELSLQDRQVLELTYEDDISKEGIGRFGRLKEQMSLFRKACDAPQDVSINEVVDCMQLHMYWLGAFEEISDRFCVFEEVSAVFKRIDDEVRAARTGVARRAERLLGHGHDVPVEEHGLQRYPAFGGSCDHSDRPV